MQSMEVFSKTQKRRILNSLITEFDKAVGNARRNKKPRAPVIQKKRKPPMAAVKKKAPSKPKPAAAPEPTVAIYNPKAPRVSAKRKLIEVYEDVVLLSNAAAGKVPIDINDQIALVKEKLRRIAFE